MQGVNTTLRLAWLFSLLRIAVPAHQDAFDILVAGLEVFRRGMWNFYRSAPAHTCFLANLLQASYHAYNLLAILLQFTSQVCFKSHLQSSFLLDAELKVTSETAHKTQAEEIKQTQTLTPVRITLCVCRIENEHLNNVGKYRAVKTVPLPFKEFENMR